MHIKGYAAPETKAAVERARLLIEQAEALGEPPEDPLLLFSVLYGVLDRELCGVQRRRGARACGAVSGARREARGDRSAHDRASPDGHILLLTETSRKAERTTIRRSRFTILPSIVRWRHDLVKTSEWQSCLIGHWLYGCSAIPRPHSQTLNTRSRMRARSAKPRL